MGHNHSHAHPENGRALFWAILINLILTAVQVVGGIISGSLSLLADALHNFSDAGALIIAYIAQKISGLPANKEMTFGYGRAQILGALINSTTLVIIGFYLIYEAWDRYVNPSEKIDGWMVVWVAAVALIIDLATAWLTYAGSKESINMKAAFVHNLSDALASVVVIVSGFLIINYDVVWVDLVATVIISIYILYQSFGLIKSSIKTLMQAVPEDINKEEVIAELEKVDGVKDIHHVHIWAVYEKFRSCEAHIVSDTEDIKKVSKVKKEIKEILSKKFKISHSTLEFEFGNNDCGNS